MKLNRQTCLPLTREVARLRRDGGRENALIKPFLTTPQSPAVTAPLTRGAKNRLCQHSPAPFRQGAYFKHLYKPRFIHIKANRLCKSFIFPLLPSLFFIAPQLTRLFRCCFLKPLFPHKKVPTKFKLFFKKNVV